MGVFAELPGWLQAAGWGLLSASGLLIGAVGGYFTWLQHATIARVMTFAAGVLLAVVAVDLVLDDRGATSLYLTVMGLVCGAATNAWSNRRKSSSPVADWPLRPARSSTAFRRA